MAFMFVLSERVSYPYGSGRKFEDMIAEVALLLFENYRERFVSIPKVLGDLF